MLEAQTVSVSIARPWGEVYEAIWRPQDFARWASGLSKSSLEKDGDAWKAQGPDGPIRVRFTDHNAFGIMDHKSTSAAAGKSMCRCGSSPTKTARRRC